MPPHWGRIMKWNVEKLLEKVKQPLKLPSQPPVETLGSRLTKTKSSYFLTAFKK